MLGGHGRWRAFNVVVAALAPCALAVALTAAPAVAASCPSLSNVKSYSGTASMSFSGSQSGPDGSGGTMSVSISHSEDDMTLSSMLPDKSGNDYIGTPSGAIDVNDSYTDVVPGGGGGTATQTANGGPNSQGDSVVINFIPSSCVYSMTMEMSTPTTAQATGNGPNDGGISDSAITQSSIPYSSLSLTGTETIEAWGSVGGDTLPEIEAGEYVVGGPFSAWSNDLNDAAGTSPGPNQTPVGTATISWDLTPTLTTKVCTVPALAGLTQAAATTALTKANCALGTVTTQASATVAKGKVISSNPPAGNVEAGGTPVALTVSSGPNCIVPALAGDTLVAAKAALTAANCGTGTATKQTSTSVAKGDVISSSPGAGSTQAKGFKVNLTVSSGPKCTVPALAGEALAAAKSALKAAHCDVGAETKKASSSVAKGDVISSSPAAGTVEAAGTKVKLKVSSGKAAAKVSCKVPTVKGKSESAAKTALKAAHCGVGAVTKKASSSVAKGDVISSSPGAGTTHSKGTKVKLTVSSGPTVSCKVPAVTGETEAAAKTALKSANCGVGTVTDTASSTVAKGDVISSSPGAGTTHVKGTKVSLTVSSGPAYPIPAA